MVDSRRGINDHDATMMDTLNKTYIPYQVCLKLWNCTYVIRTRAERIITFIDNKIIQIVFTKVDLTTKEELYTSLGQAFSIINSSMGGACLPFIPTLSTVDKTGLDHFKLAMGEIYGQNWDF